MAATAAAVVAVNFLISGNSLLFPGSVLLPVLAALGVLVALRVDVVTRMNLLPIVTSGFLAAAALTIFTGAVSSDEWGVNLSDDRSVFLSSDWPLYVVAALGASLFTVAIACVVSIVLGVVARGLSPMARSIIGAIAVGAWWIVQLGFLGDGWRSSVTIVGLAAAMGFVV